MNTSSGETTYSYDALGRRTSRTSGGETEVAHYGDLTDVPIFDTGSGGEVLRSYVTAWPTRSDSTALIDGLIRSQLFLPNAQRVSGALALAGSPGPINAQAGTQDPAGLTEERQRAKLDEIERRGRPLYRAYLLKEQLRQIYRLAPDQAIEPLDTWLSWARRCRLKPFVKLAKTIAAQRPGVVAAIRHGLSNALVESINTKIRPLTRRAFGFHSPAALIALAMLKPCWTLPLNPGTSHMTHGNVRRSLISPRYGHKTASRDYFQAVLITRPLRIDSLPV